MSKQMKLRRGTTAQHSTFTGASGEVTVDTDKKVVVVHDGTTAGGNPLLSASAGAVGAANLATNAVTTVKIADLNVTSAKLADNSVTYAKMQSVTAGKVLGRDTSGAGVLQELPIAVDTSGNVAVTSVKTSANVVTGGANSGIWFTGSLSDFTVGLGRGASNELFFQTNSTSRAAIDSSGNLKFNSGYGSVATAYGCRAWVNFNGTGTVAIRSSGNVSSITDNGVGDYTANFTIALPDVNYAVSGLAGIAPAVGPTYLQVPGQSTDYTQTTSVFRFGTATAHANGVVAVPRDTDKVFVAVFR